RAVRISSARLDGYSGRGGEDRAIGGAGDRHGRRRVAALDRCRAVLALKRMEGHGAIVVECPDHRKHPIERAAAPDTRIPQRRAAGVGGAMGTTNPEPQTTRSFTLIVTSRGE